MVPSADTATNEPPRRRWGDGIRRRRLQRAQSAPVVPASTPIKQQQDPSFSDGGTDSSLLSLLEENSKELLLRRPDRISITYAKTSEEAKLGLRLRVVQTGGADNNGNKKQKNQQAHTQIQIDGKCRAGDGDGDGGPLSQINPSALREGSHHSLTYFEPGDVLEYVNDLDCRQVTELGEINAHIEAKRSRTGAGDDDGEISQDVQTKVSMCPPPTTIAVSTPGTMQGNDSILSSIGAQLHQAIAMRSEDENITMPYLGIQFGLTDGEGGEEGELLAVRKIVDSGWFASPACAVKEGDLVIGINEYICSALSPDDATVLLEAVAAQSTQLSITTLSLPKGNAKGKLAKLRKAAVTAGGGSLVVCGSALMVTPLHPIGHAMAIGGVAALSTEYEAPKRALESAKSRLRRSPKPPDCEEESKDNVHVDPQQATISEVSDAGRILEAAPKDVVPVESSDIIA